MKKISSLLCFLFITVSAAIAGSEDYHIIPKDTVYDFSAFNRVKVIDLRINKEDFGYIKTGAFNSTQQLQPKNPELMFQQFAESIIAPAVKKEDNTLIIVLRNFKITDRATGNELGTFYSRMSFYVGKEDAYHPVLEVDSFYETASAWDVTNAILGIANLKTTKWIMKAAKKEDGTNLAKSLSEKEIIDLSTQKKPYPIYNEAPKSGIYLTEEDFLNNHVSACDLMAAHYPSSDNGIYRLYKKNEKGKFKININDEDWFAVYSNGKWYKKTSMGPCLMNFSNNDFYFPELGTGLRANDAAGAMFGVVGILIANSGKGSVIYNFRYTPGTGGGKAVARLN